MIELIFVIVILGILATVAIPKLVATRHDAQMSSMLERVRDASREMINFYTARGKEINFSYLEDNQSIVGQMVNDGWVYIKNDTVAYLYSNIDTNTVCATYTTDKQQIELDINETNNDELCSRIRHFLSDRNYSILNSVVKF